MKHINEIKPEVKTSTNSLVSALFKDTSVGTTENGAKTYTRTASALVDFFAQAGAMRGRVDDAVTLFSRAYSEDKLTAVRLMFYFRDIRGGQGERNLFRECLKWLAENDKDVFATIIKYVPEYGRFDDIFFDSEVCIEAIKNQLMEDSKTPSPSLLAKWLPTINASSPTTRAKAKAIAQMLGITDINYRKTVRALRAKIKTVEEKMSANKWSEIDYSHVPSRANKIYSKAFKRHDEDRYSAFIDSAEKGEVKINSSTLYPYEIYKSVVSNNPSATALWNALPDYTQGKNALVVADVSGSMSGDPMAVSVSLAMYFAERNVGAFNGYFMTFSEKPTLQKVVGTTLKEKINNLERAHWGMNTNLQAVFTTILSTAVQNKIPQAEMPSTIYIISDMEFDSCVSGKTNLKSIREEYTQAGYEVPSVVFWNVNSRQNNLPSWNDETGVALVSGLSPSVFKMAVEDKTPEQVMLDTANSERYSQIVI